VKHYRVRTLHWVNSMNSTMYQTTNKIPLLLIELDSLYCSNGTEFVLLPSIISPQYFFVFFAAIKIIIELYMFAGICYVNHPLLVESFLILRCCSVKFLFRKTMCLFYWDVVKSSFWIPIAYLLFLLAFWRSENYILSMRQSVLCPAQWMCQKTFHTE
jgi:hypothetical protein